MHLRLGRGVGGELHPFSADGNLAQALGTVQTPPPPPWKSSQFFPGGVFSMDSDSSPNWFGGVHTPQTWPKTREKSAGASQVVCLLLREKHGMKKASFSRGHCHVLLFP